MVCPDDLMPHAVPGLMMGGTGGIAPSLAFHAVVAPGGIAA